MTEEAFCLPSGATIVKPLLSRAQDTATRDKATRHIKSCLADVVVWTTLTLQDAAEYFVAQEATWIGNVS